MISRKRVKRKSQLQKLFTVRKPRANHKERTKIEISIQSHRTWRLCCKQILWGKYSSKTRIKRRMLRKGKNRPAKSHPSFSPTLVAQEPLISHSKKFDKKRHFLNTLQKLRNTVESLYLDQKSIRTNTNKHGKPLNSPPLTPEAVRIPNDEFQEKGKFLPESEDYEIELTAVKLLQLLQARNGKSSTMPKDGTSGMEEQAVARINDSAEFFDAMLVDYAKRVHNYKDPSLEEARRPMPLLNMNKKL